MSKIAEMIQKKLASSAAQSEQPVKAAPGSSHLVRQLLLSKQVDDSKTAAVLLPGLSDPALPDSLVGKEVTYGDLKLRLSEADRPDGTVGPHYPVCFSLSHGQADTIISYLRSRPKAGNGGRPNQQRQAAAAPQTADGGLAAEVASLKADMSALIELMPQIIAEATQSARPTEGHSKAPAASQPVEPVAESRWVQSGPNEILVHQPGDVIWVEIDGEAVELQITEDAKRLRKTIVG